MSTCDLKSLLVNLDGINVAAIEEKARVLYVELYLNKGRVGVHATHDGEDLIFHHDAFDHAFFTSSDWRCFPERKDVLRVGSIERIHWIGELVRGNIPGSACFEVPSPTGRYRPPNRVYVIFETPDKIPFVVWLEPRKNGGWKFKTAYPVVGSQVHACTKGGRTVWRWKDKSPVIKPAHGATSHVQIEQ
jgi:hypothetical protein